MSRRLQTNAVLLTAVLVLASFAAVGVGAAEGDGPTEVSSCTVIDEPGRYVLTTDLTERDEAVCIDIQSNDVYFDGNGYTVDGVQTPESLNATLQGPLPDPTNVSIGLGIGTTAQFSNVTITDVTVSDSYYGMFLTNASDVTVSDATATGSGGGIFLNNSSDSTVVDSNASANGVGVFVDSLGGQQIANNAVTDTTASENAFLGIAVFNATDTLVADNTVESNGFVGILAFQDIEGATIVDNRIVNSSEGIAVGNASGVYVADNDIDGPGYLGIDFNNVSQGVVAHNTVTGMDGSQFFPVSYPGGGVLLDDSSSIVVYDTTASDNNGSGITLVNGSNDTLLFANDLTNNSEDGVTLNDSDTVAVALTTASDNADDGVEVTDSNRVVLVRNTLTGNGDQPLEVNDSTDVRRVDSLADLVALLGDLLRDLRDEVDDR